MLTSREYSNEHDKLRMADLAQQNFAKNLHVIDLPYRFTTQAFDDPQNVHLWFDGEQLVAWALCNPPFWTIDISIAPAFSERLHPLLLEWAEGNARRIMSTCHGHTCWFIKVDAGDAVHRRDLEQAGYADQSDVGKDSWSCVQMERPGSLPVKAYPPPQGFQVRPLHGAQEVQAYVDLHRSVFHSRSMNTAWRQRMLAHPAYRPDLDLVVETPDGRLGAFCIAWFDDLLKCGQVEPLGCHTDFRSRALGRVALSEGLRRLQAMGAENIYVDTDNYRNTAFALYESMGFHVVRDVLVYRKDFVFRYDDPEMTAPDVTGFVRLLQAEGIGVVIDGGWGVDALLGRQTRKHADLDIAVEHRDVPRLRALLESKGYHDLPQDDTRDCNFVMGDDGGRQVDLHSYTFDEHGSLTFGVAYPFESLKGEGMIDGFPVRCITPEWMVKFHTGYKLDENDYRDVKHLCRQFGLEMPAEYADFVKVDQEK